MYRCLECGYIFDDESVTHITELIGEAWGRPVYENRSVCPICGEAFEEVEPCRICGKYETIENGEEICEDCKVRVVKDFKRLINQNFLAEEIEFLKEFLEEEEL